MINISFILLSTPIRKFHFLRNTETSRSCGNKTETGQGVDRLAENDVLFNGNMQNWKQLANSLKLRMGLRAHGAAGEDFAATAISSKYWTPSKSIVAAVSVAPVFVIEILVTMAVLFAGTV